jgi:hypothetical protein
VAYDFQIESNKIKLLTEYESVTQKLLLFIDSMLQNAKQFHYSTPFIFRKQFSFVLSGLKIIGHGESDNNLESNCICLVCTVHAT